MSNFKDIDIEKIFVSKTNPRTEFDSQAINELADSIKSHGLLQPIVVRTIGNRYELISGERRFRAITLLNKKTITCHIIEMTDDEAFEAQIIENLQRKDVNPMDEAAAYQRLLDRPNYNIHEVCLKVGKEAQYVHRRLKLNDLIPKYKTALFEGKILLAHAIELCRLTPDDQKEAEEYLYEYGDTTVNPKDLRDSILQNIVLILDKAPFDTKDSTLVKKTPACTQCPNRSGFNKTLFGDIDKTDRCFNKACFNLKAAASIQQKIEKDDDLVLIRKHWDDEKEPLKAFKKPILSSNDFKVVEKPNTSKCEDLMKAIYVVGSDQGKQITICANKNCKIHNPHAKNVAQSSEMASLETLKYKIERGREIKTTKTLELLWPEIKKYNLKNDTAGIAHSVAFTKLFRLSIVHSLGYTLTKFFEARNIKGGGSNYTVALENYDKFSVQDWCMMHLLFITQQFGALYTLYELEPLVKDLAEYMLIPVDDILQTLNDTYAKREANLLKQIDQLSTKEISPGGREVKVVTPKKSIKKLIKK
jgi:ParB/RepB/Spo0J family partition protein